MKLFDLIVIGAGPAGNSCAFHAARKGLTVLLLEENEKIGVPVHCGECISNIAIKKIDAKVPSEVISSKIEGIRIVFPDGKKSSLTEKGVVLEKHLFEQWLAAMAVANGTEFRLKTKAESMQRKNNEWIVKTNKGEFRGKIVIDGSGVQAFSSKVLGLNKIFKSTIGLQYELSGLKNDNWLDFFLWPDIAPKGYAWIIPKSNGRANIGLVSEERINVKELLDKFVKKIGYDEKKINKTFGGLIPSSGPVEKTFSDGLMLIGDAAGFTSPLFEGGTHLSLVSGKFAAEIALNAVEAEDFSAEFLSKYQTKWKNEFPDYSKLVKGKEFLHDFSIEELNFVGKIFPQELHKVTKKDKLKIGLKVLTKNPKILLKGFIPAMNAFGYSRAKNYGW